jgi:hypothetical protein
MLLFPFNWSFRSFEGTARLAPLARQKTVRYDTNEFRLQAVFRSRNPVFLKGAEWLGRRNPTESR